MYLFQRAFSRFGIGASWLYNKNGLFRLEIPVIFELPKNGSSSIAVQTLGHYLLLNNERVSAYPFAGASLSYTTTKYTNPISGESVKKSDTGFVIPFGVGIDFKVTPNFSLNLGVNFGLSFANSETKVGFGAVTIGFRL